MVQVQESSPSFVSMPLISLNQAINSSHVLPSLFIDMQISSAFCQEKNYDLLPEGFRITGGAGTKSVRPLIILSRHSGNLEDTQLADGILFPRRVFLVDESKTIMTSMCSSGGSGIKNSFFDRRPSGPRHMQLQVAILFVKHLHVIDWDLINGRRNTHSHAQLASNAELSLPKERGTQWRSSPITAHLQQLFVLWPTLNKIKLPRRPSADCRKWLGLSKKWASRPSSGRTRFLPEYLTNLKKERNRLQARLPGFSIRWVSHSMIALARMRARPLQLCHSYQATLRSWCCTAGRCCTPLYYINSADRPVAKVTVYFVNYMYSLQPVR